MNKVLMRFFRDLSRSKARKRLYGNQHALIPMLLGREEFILNKTADDKYAEDALTMTAEELASFNGEDDGPLYICITGRIYDVTAGSKFYGPEARYHGFVGKDATRAFATGCKQAECISSSTEGLTEKEWKEIDRWLELYETHDKYTFVGFLVDDPVDMVLADDENESKEENEGEQAYN
jgi:predicted heme/steroid binding protein